MTDAPTTQAPYIGWWHIAPGAGAAAFAAAWAIAGVFGPSADAVAGFFLIVSLPLICLSFVTFYLERKRLAAADSEWTPNIWSYTLLQLLTTPIVGGSLYLIQRWRYVGLGATARQ